MFVSNAVLELAAEAGAQYQLQYSTDVQFGGTNSYCDFWIVDSKTGKSITNIQRGAVRGSGQGTTYMPIYIPKR